MWAEHLQSVFVGGMFGFAIGAIAARFFFAFEMDAMRESVAEAWEVARKARLAARRNDTCHRYKP